MCVLSLQSCLTLCALTDYSLPGSSVHGILQTRILEWVAISFSKGSSQPRDQTWVSLIAQLVKNPPAMQETLVRFLDWKDPLEEGMATHLSVLAWRIPWTEEPGRLQSMGS